jgi:hypothetical protein
MNKKLQKKIDEAYDFLTKTSETFRNCSMDEQGQISIELGKELLKREEKNVSV